MVARGLIPDEATVQRWQAEQNLPRETVLANWQQHAAQTSTEWLLCANCAGRAAAYRRSDAVYNRLPRWAWVLIGLAARQLMADPMGYHRAISS
jgi:hypothetical protein